jgi:hypothetical protein
MDVTILAERNAMLEADTKEKGREREKTDSTKSRNKRSDRMQSREPRLETEEKKMKCQKQRVKAIENSELSS